MASLDQARAAKDKAKNLFRDNNIAGVGITKIAQEYAVKVNLHKPISTDVEYPEVIDGVPVHFEIVGDIRKQDL
jgi:hypothetical protein